MHAGLSSVVIVPTFVGGRPVYAAEGDAKGRGPRAFPEGPGDLHGRACRRSFERVRSGVQAVARVQAPLEYRSGRRGARPLGRGGRGLRPPSPRGRRASGQRAGRTGPLPKPLPVNAGKHTAEALLVGHTTQARSVDVAGRAAIAIESVLEAIAVPGPELLAPSVSWKRGGLSIDSVCVVGRVIRKRKGR
jgi:hypothetical protein